MSHCGGLQIFEFFDGPGHLLGIGKNAIKTTLEHNYLFSLGDVYIILLGKTFCTQAPVTTEEKRKVYHNLHLENHHGDGSK